MSAPVSVADVVALGRACYLTGSILQEWARRATPKQREFLHAMLTAEHDSRQDSRRSRLLKAAHLPAVKSLQGYDWTAVRFPADYDQARLTALEFIDHAHDLVLFGDVGTGKTHLACALVAACCRNGTPARYYTASALVMALRRAKDAGRLDKELSNLARNQLIAIDELGYLPIDADGARLLFQVISDAYEQRSLIITTNLEFSRWGTVFGDNNMAAAIIDRLVHHGRLLQFHGDSYRVGHALMK